MIYFGFQTYNCMLRDVSDMIVTEGVSPEPRVKDGRENE